jgi:hypothetical protein
VTCAGSRTEKFFAYRQGFAARRWLVVLNDSQRDSGRGARRARPECLEQLSGVLKPAERPAVGISHHSGFAVCIGEPSSIAGVRHNRALRKINDEPLCPFERDVAASTLRERAAGPGVQSRSFSSRPRSSARAFSPVFRVRRPCLDASSSPDTRERSRAACRGGARCAQPEQSRHLEASPSRRPD